MDIASRNRVLGKAGERQLRLPECRLGIGDVIVEPRSSKLIDGACVDTYELWPDDRGYFLEVARVGEGQASGFPAGTTQVSASLGYPGTIKAFHYHRLQADLWVPCQGMLQVALVDLRDCSRTFAQRNTFFIGTMRPWRLLIPPGVAHGYKVIGDMPAMLVYVTDRHYDPSDEGRLPFDCPEIAYDWETQHK